MELFNDDIEAARVYHEVTKHSYTSVRSGGHLLDWDNKPLPYKIYPDTAAVALNRDLALSAAPALNVLSAALPDSASRPLSLDSLTRILFCAGGLTQRRRVGDQDYHFRAAASAGALYPSELYVASSKLEGLQPGLYHFSPADLKLRGLRRGDWRANLADAAAMPPSLANAAAVIVLTSIFWRSAWKYRARCYRYCFWDAGTMLTNLLAAANAEGISAEVVSAFVDRELESLLAIDGDEEGVVGLVALGKAPPSQTEPATPAPLELETVPLSAEQVRYDDLVKIHRSSRLVDSAQVRWIASAQFERPTNAAAPQGIQLSVTLPEDGGLLGETILRRGSTRVFAREPLSKSQLGTIVSVLSPPAPIDFPPLTEIYLIVNSADGIEPGAYYYSRTRGDLHVLKAGDFRTQSGYLSLEQRLGADCSTLIVFMSDLERVFGALGNRGYRDAHLEAGILGGRAYLAAYALGCGATGLTFYDDDTTNFFSPHAAGLSPLLMVAVGVPRGKSADPES